MTTGLFIGRFQPFHNGHLYAIKSALNKVDKLIIVIGSSQYINTLDNPFSYEERKKMIKKTLDKEKIKNYSIFPVSDIGDDKKWVVHLKISIPKFDVVFTGNEFVRKLFKEKRYKIEKVDYLEGVNGSNIRELVLRNKNWQAFVPKEAVKVIDDINGVERLKKIFGKK